MLIKPFVDEKLGNSSYLLGSEETGLAAVIDPQRDVDKYVQTAEGLGLRLAYALDTHLHNDFVSGARELAAQVGLRVGASAEAELAFEHLPLHDGDALALGDLTIGVLATPGHTPEHIGFTLVEPNRTEPSVVFTGGALMVGGAARTDLLGQHLAVDLARQLYHALHAQLLKLSDAVTVYPTHGAGSFCAAPTSSERITTIGRERKSNALLLADSEDTFVEMALAGLPSYPVYYQHIRPINRSGPKILGGLPVLKPLSPAEVQQWIEQGGAVLDVRPARRLAEGYIPGAYTIAHDAPLVTWAGWLIPFGAPLVLVAADAANREDAIRQLIRIGYDDLRGYLDGGLPAWEAAGLPVTRMQKISVAELRARIGDGDAPIVIDVRQDAEWQAGHIPGALHIENGRLPYDDLPLPIDRPIYLHCRVRDRSTAALSVLARRGYRDLTLVDGGFKAWKEAGYEIESGSGNE
ncbi:MAG TPA: rhodanese-like domain-containing protein [Anaerolineae bacterium]|nr:rhodanese-like domain-containing protein [Anaerolineae bacterium]